MTEFLINLDMVLYSYGFVEGRCSEGREMVMSLHQSWWALLQRTRARNRQYEFIVVLSVILTRYSSFPGVDRGRRTSQWQICWCGALKIHWGAWLMDQSENVGGSITPLLSQTPTFPRECRKKYKPSTITKKRHVKCKRILDHNKRITSSSQCNGQQQFFCCQLLLIYFFCKIWRRYLDFSWQC